MGIFELLDKLFWGGQPVHRDFCCQFQLHGRMFEAVGFLNRFQSDLRGWEAIDRVDNGLVVSSQKDWQFILQHRNFLPEELNNYYLITKTHMRGTSDAVYVLQTPENGDRNPFYTYLGYRWYKSDLILRRCE